MRAAVNGQARRASRYGPTAVAAAACLALAAPALAQVATGATVRGAIVGAVIDGAAGAQIGRTMDAQVRDLQARLGHGAQVERVGEGFVVRLDAAAVFPLAFDRPSPMGRSIVREIAASLDEFPDTEVLIVGHTDSSGDAADNMGLSYRRAEAAKAVLVGAGIASARVRVEGRGSAEPVASNATAEGRRRNQRLEIGVFASETRRNAFAGG